MTGGNPEKIPNTFIIRASEEPWLIFICMKKKLGVDTTVTPNTIFDRFKSDNTKREIEGCIV